MHAELMCAHGVEAALDLTLGDLQERDLLAAHADQSLVEALTRRRVVALLHVALTQPAQQRPHLVRVRARARARARARVGVRVRVRVGIRVTVGVGVGVGVSGPTSCFWLSSEVAISSASVK